MSSAVAEMGANTSELLRLLHAERALRELAESDARRATQLLLQPRRSPWKPKRKVAVCIGSGHTDRPLVSAIVQTFGDGSNARQLTTRLHAALPAAQLEVIINDDSGRDHGRWLALLRQPNDFAVSSPNIHEIRAYNRLARLARGDFLLLLQGDHCLPSKADWLRQGLAIFRRLPHLGLLGGQMGFNQVPTRRIAENVSWGAAPCHPIPLLLPPRAGGGGAEGGEAGGEELGEVPFMFVAGVNIGPLLVRRAAYLRAGGFDEAFSCAGEPGIQLDTELSLQMWRRGYHVGLWYSGVSNGVGGRKTRKNPAQKRVRLRNDEVNGRRCKRLLRDHDAAAVAAANAQLRDARDATAARAQASQDRGALDANQCEVGLVE